MKDRERLLALKRAVKANEPEVARRLLMEKPQLALARGRGWAPFQDAAFQGKAEILRVMLEHGEGITPADIARALHHAVQLPHEDPESVEVLLATGQVSEAFCLLYRADVDGLAALVAAEEYIVRQLVARGADLEARGPFGKSALSACACNRVDRKKRSRTLRLLLESGADVNGRTFGGRTPLFAAATAGWGPEESVKVLLQNGADVNHRNDDGRTALEEALANPSARSRRVAGVLREAGAQG